MATNTGTYDMDATGSFIRDACVATNGKFATLFAATSGTPQVINTGKYANDGSGDNMATAFNTINANFAYLWTLASYSNPPQVINTTSVGNVDGVVGYPADPGKLAWLKVNANFAVLGL